MHRRGLDVAAEIGTGGKQRVSEGGLASGTCIQSGGWQLLDFGGSAKGVSVFSGGSQRVDAGGTAWGTVLQDGGRMSVLDGGTASDATILSRGRADIKEDGTAGKVTVCSGGTAIAWSGGLLQDAVIAFGGRAYAKAGGSAMGLNLAPGASLTLSAGAVLAGTNFFNGAKVFGGSATARAVLASGAVLSAAGLTDMSKLHLDARSASIFFSGPGNKLGTMLIDSGTHVEFSIAHEAAGQRTVLAGAVSGATAATFAVDAAKAQAPGFYRLASGFGHDASSAVWNLHAGGSATAIEAGGAAVSAGGMDWQLKLYGAQICLSASVRAGWMKRGTAANNALAGSADGEVFWGGAGGNDVISGNGGRDCAIWGAENWGQDAVAVTSGTMSIVFDGLAEADVTSSLAGSVMTFAKTADASQTITVSGWAAETHSIVFASGMSAFNAWASAASPTLAQAKAARTEVWKKAGLAAA